MPAVNVWRLAPSLKLLLTQIDAKCPGRSKANDGTIGDARHQAERSDHNPNGRGVVCAIDITHDPGSGCDAGRIAEALRASRNPRLNYVIWNRQIFSSHVSPWISRPYAGSSPHTEHIHISVFDETADDFPWPV